MLPATQASGAGLPALPRLAGAAAQDEYLRLFLNLQRATQAAGAGLPPLPRLAGGAAQDAARGAVVPSLGSAVEWLRGCVRQRPGLRMQARHPLLVVI